MGELWTQTESKGLFEGFLDVITVKAKAKGLVFGHCGTKIKPKCPRCDRSMNMFTARKGAQWNRGRKFFKCWTCAKQKDGLDVFLWVDGTSPHSEPAYRRCAEFSKNDVYGF